MEKDELYPELIDYIFEYCGKYFTEDESKANGHLTAMFKSKNNVHSPMYKFFMKEENVLVNQQIVDLVKDGFEKFKIRVVTRIYSEHKHSLDLNLCTKCWKIARTPDARQCRFCFHDWH